MKQCPECLQNHDELGDYCESCIVELIEHREVFIKRGD